MGIGKSYNFLPNIWKRWFEFIHEGTRRIESTENPLVSLFSETYFPRKNFQIPPHPPLLLPPLLSIISSPSRRRFEMKTRPLHRPVRVWVLIFDLWSVIFESDDWFSAKRLGALSSPRSTAAIDPPLGPLSNEQCLTTAQWCQPWCLLIRNHFENTWNFEIDRKLENLDNFELNSWNQKILARIHTFQIFQAPGGQSPWMRNAGRKKSHPVWEFFRDLKLESQWFIYKIYFPQLAGSHHG